MSNANELKCYLQAKPISPPEVSHPLPDPRLRSRLGMDHFRPIAVLGRGHFGKVRETTASLWYKRDNCQSVVYFTICYECIIIVQYCIDLIETQFYIL